MVSYAFPPVGGAGVQRVLKLVKYLPRWGVIPSVLTAKGPSVPVFDPSLARDVPADIDVLRARTLEPSYSAKARAWQASAHVPLRGLRGVAKATLSSRVGRALSNVSRRLLVPDPQILWLPAAALTLARTLVSNPPDVVFISGPPFSQFLLALIARLRPSTGVVLDYRDEWSTTGSVYEMAGSPRAAAFLERRLLRKAHVITTATEEFRGALLARFPFLAEDTVVSIPNGYDPEDFPAELPTPPNDRFVLAYVGTVFRLTSARGFLAGLERFHREAPELARHVDTRFVGRIVSTEERVFDGSEALGVRRLGYVEHAHAIRELAASHLALCLLDDVSGVERIYPAKIFEIMHLRKPCLAITPEGALARLVRRCHAGDVVSPRDPAAIAEALDRSVRRFLDGSSLGGDHFVDVERFDRKAQARTFALAFQSALGSARQAASI